MKNDAEWDAVVVGAGAGGAAAAYGLCQRDVSVLLLDAGPQFNPIVDYPLTESDWEARDFPEKPGSAASVTFAPGQKLTGAGYAISATINNNFMGFLRTTAVCCPCKRRQGTQYGSNHEKESRLAIIRSHRWRSGHSIDSNSELLHDWRPFCDLRLDTPPEDLRR
ncbi:MAG: NAD(P)-binding protein [Xanthobacteraceae bacterium]